MKNIGKLQKPQGILLPAMFLLLWVLSAPVMKAQQTLTRTYTINLTNSDRTIVTDMNGYQQVEMDTLEASVIYQTGKPMMPHCTVRFVVDGRTTAASATVTRSNVSSTNNIRLSPMFIPVSTDGTETGNYMEAMYDTTKTYGTPIVHGVELQDMGGFKVVTVCYTPFKYFAATKKMYFYRRCAINLTLTIGNEQTTPVEWNRDIVSGMVLNPDSLATLYPVALPAPDQVDVSDRVDYLIITPDSMKSAFDDFVFLKDLKGIVTHVVSKEDILSEFTSGSEPLRIKQYIKQVKDNNPELKYVLLAGDATKIPVVRCYNRFIKLTYDEETLTTKNDTLQGVMPSDMYYACLSGNLDWDINNNGIYAEIDDSADLKMDIVVSRISFSSCIDILNYNSKDIKYECHNEMDSLEFDVLLSGSQTAASQYGTGISHAHQVGLSVKNMIDGFQSCKCDYVFDTGSNILSQPYQLNAQTLTDILSRGCYVLNMECHGNEYSWGLSNSMFSSIDALHLSLKGPVFVFTSSCNTNDISYPDYLGGALLRNPSILSLGYIGCSTTNFFRCYDGSWGGPKYNMTFYKDVLKSPYKNYGDYYAKSKKILGYGLVSESVSKWLYLGINMIGDPTLKIFLHRPSDFQLPYSYMINNTLCVQTDSTTSISLVRNQNNEFHVFKSYWLGMDNAYWFCNVPFQWSRDMRIGILPKENAMKIIEPLKSTDLFLQNYVLTDNNSLSFRDVHIGHSVTDEIDFGHVVFKNGSSTEIVASNSVVFTGGVVAEKGAKFVINGY